MKKILLFFTQLLVCGFLYAQDPIEIDGLFYILNDGCAEMASSPKGYEGDIIIPESVYYQGESYIVTSLGWAFRECTNLTSVTIPNTITSLDEAFVDCNHLITVNIPNSVVTMNWTFIGCTSLIDINIPESVEELIGTFIECTMLASVNIPNSVKTIIAVR